MIHFIKMHGLGNDFAVIDNRKGGALPALRLAKLADRHFGVGCDQIVILEKSAKADVLMRIFNADGGEVESCGNASRCVAWLIRSQKPGTRSQRSVTIETLAGVIEAWVMDSAQVTIDMGQPKSDWREIPLAEKKDTLHLKIGKPPLLDPVAVNVGNPHMVFFVPDVHAIALHELGAELEHHPLFPARANIGVAHVLPPSNLPPQAGGGKVGGIALRVWERGAGLTLACGTGACAALVAAHRRGLTGRKAAVHLPGGDLFIEWREDDDHVLMTGPAAISYRGEFDEKEFAA